MEFVWIVKLSVALSACSGSVFHALSMTPPPEGLGVAGTEILGRGPGPARLRIHGDVQNVEIFFAFTLRPDLNKLDQLSA
jgi:hypothetical protein